MYALKFSISYSVLFYSDISELGQSKSKQANNEFYYSIAPRNHHAAYLTYLS